MTEKFESTLKSFVDKVSKLDVNVDLDLHISKADVGPRLLNFNFQVLKPFYKIEGDTGYGRFAFAFVDNVGDIYASISWDAFGGDPKGNIFSEFNGLEAINKNGCIK